MMPSRCRLGHPPGEDCCPYATGRRAASGRLRPGRYRRPARIRATCERRARAETATRLRGGSGSCVARADRPHWRHQVLPVRRLGARIHHCQGTVRTLTLRWDRTRWLRIPSPNPQRDAGLVVRCLDGDTASWPRGSSRASRPASPNRPSAPSRARRTCINPVPVRKMAGGGQVTSRELRRRDDPVAAPVTEAAIEKVRQLIIGGELGPGCRLPPEAVLAERLGVSRGSAREAVRALVTARSSTSGAETVPT
jgi:hypothetical protein